MSVSTPVSFHEVFEPYYPWFIVAKLICFNFVTMYIITNNFLENRRNNISSFLYNPSRLQTAKAVNIFMRTLFRNDVT